MILKQIVFKKSISSLILVMIFVMTSFISANAESLFLKDGSIIEGTIVSETDANIKFKSADGKTKDIRRTEVMRVVHHTDFNQKKYIYKTDNSLLEAFIVDEDKHFYTYRVDLNSAAEFKILKNEIETISKKKLEFSSDVNEKNMTREERLKIRAPRVRLGAGYGLTQPEVMTGLTDNQSSISLNFDVAVYRMRNSKSNGFDFFLRGLINNFENDTEQNGGVGTPNFIYPAVVNNYFGDVIPSDFWVLRIKWDQLGCGAGIRYVHGFYLGGLLWQGYLMGYYQYSIISITIEGWTMPLPINNMRTYDVESVSHGIVGGIGMEIALFSNFGIFIEATTGYSSAFKTEKNIEQQIIRAGATLRTSYL